MSEAKSITAPWLSIVLALIAIVPPYLSYLAGQRGLEEKSRDAGTAAVYVARDQIDPSVEALNRQVALLTGRVEELSKSLTSVHAGLFREPERSDEPAAARVSGRRPSSGASASGQSGAAPKPASPTAATDPNPATASGDSASGARPSIDLSQLKAAQLKPLPLRPTLKADQFKLSSAIQKSLNAK